MRHNKNSNTNAQISFKFNIQDNRQEYADLYMKEMKM